MGKRLREETETTAVQSGGGGGKQKKKKSFLAATALSVTFITNSYRHINFMHCMTHALAQRIDMPHY